GSKTDLRETVFMIIDIRMRLEALRQDPDLLDEHAENALEQFDCVDAAVIAGHRSERLGSHVPAEGIAGVVNRHPERFAGFAGIDPTLESALDDIDRAVDLGMAGAVISPADQGCRATSDACMAALERCGQRRLPVLVANAHLRDPRSVLEFARPDTLDEAARSFRDLTLILGDLGHGYLDDALLMVVRHERVFAEISTLIGKPWRLYNALLSAHESDVMDKLIFGSGAPDISPESAIERVYSINGIRAGSSLPAIPRESLRRIVERDSLTLLGVDHELGPARSAEAALVRPAASSDPVNN
ncbi:MAG: amidohydrolase family protein, partial [Planctomycetota bacterium]|nr:amidohydrolase family protein [Planctomycetota bacterium]